MDLKKLVIVLENCEYGTFLPKDIVSFNIEDKVKRKMKRCKNGTYRLEKKTENVISLVVKRNAKYASKIRTDVTWVDLEFTNGHSEKFQVYWTQKDTRALDSSSLQSVLYDEETITWKSGTYI
jgi:hypothetical protein